MYGRACAENLTRRWRLPHYRGQGRREGAQTCNGTGRGFKTSSTRCCVHEGRDGLSFGKVGTKRGFLEITRTERDRTVWIFGYIPAARAARDDVYIGCPRALSAGYYRNPLVFRRPLLHFFPSPLSRTPLSLASHVASSTRSLAFSPEKPTLPTHRRPDASARHVFLLYCLFSFTQARDYLLFVICFYRRVRTSGRFNFTRVKRKTKNKKNIALRTDTKTVFVLFILF